MPQCRVEEGWRDEGVKRRRVQNEPPKGLSNNLFTLELIESQLTFFFGLTLQHVGS